jgi:NAD(P)-dependent dehydrogenase (short-subunit alcohol dehydrogenase family)
VTDAHFAELFETNVRGPFKIVQAVLPVIRRGGRIIQISSRAARVPIPGILAAYAASKAAMDAITRAVATEYAAEKGITANNVMVGPTDTGEWAPSRAPVFVLRNARFRARLTCAAIVSREQMSSDPCQKKCGLSFPAWPSRRRGWAHPMT